MWRVGALVWLRFGSISTIQFPFNRGCKNFVMSDALWQLEAQCEKCCPEVVQNKNQKVTVVGAASDIGSITCLFLKQQNVIKILAMYDDNPERKVIGVANDLAHIDTSTAVEAYQGRPYLRAALNNTDVVLICGGYNAAPPNCSMLDRQLFFYNMNFVRTITIACAHFCPNAIVCIQTPPVDCNFNLCKYTLKQYHVYDSRRLFGVNAINSMRANQLYCAIADFDPAKHYAPVVGGTGRTTRVPVFSNMESYVCMAKDQIDCITRLVRDADELVCRVQSKPGQGHLSIGFSTARFVTQIMKGIYGKPAFLDSAFVEQMNPEQCYGLTTCATPLKVGRGGILEYMIPTLNDKEKELLEESKCDLQDMLELGRCYATGDEYVIAPCKTPPSPPSPPPPQPCPICKPGSYQPIKKQLKG